MDDELASLDREIREIDGQQAAPGIAANNELVQAKTDALQSAAHAWSSIPAQVGLAVTIVLPECKEAFSDEACLEWGKNAARVAEKYGWGTDGLPPEAGLLLSTLGFALPVGLAIKARKVAAIQGGQGNGQARAEG